MLKKISYIAVILLVLMCGFISNSSAHAVVTHSSLNVKSILPNQERQVYLTFNSRIELDLSQVFLVSAGDKMQLLNTHYAQKPGQINIDLPALPLGEYAIKLKIFAADGHLSEDLIRFYVSSEAQ